MILSPVKTQLRQEDALMLEDAIPLLGGSRRAVQREERASFRLGSLLGSGHPPITPGRAVTKHPHPLQRPRATAQSNARTAEVRVRWQLPGIRSSNGGRSSGRALLLLLLRPSPIEYPCRSVRRTQVGNSVQHEPVV